MLESPFNNVAGLQAVRVAALLKRDSGAGAFL